MNNYTAIVNLCKPSETIELGGRPCAKLRLADNTTGKKSVARFFTAIVSGPDVEVAGRLAQGDQIVISGMLCKTEFVGTRGKTKGQTISDDEMPFAKILQVTRSPSFFGHVAPSPDSDGAPASPDSDGDPLACLGL